MIMQKIFCVKAPAILILVYFLLTDLLFAQQLQVRYTLTYQFGNTDRKTDYVLDVQNETSVFRSDMRRASDSMGCRTGLGLGYNLDPDFELFFIKDHQQQQYRKRIVLGAGRDAYMIVIAEPLHLKILPERQEVGGYSCQKATADYGGRHWTAWFASDIAVSEGPYYFHGLPGLILKVEDDTKSYSFSATSVSAVSDMPCVSAQGLQVDWPAYRQIFLEFYYNPYQSVRARGQRVVQDDGSGGYRDINYAERTRANQQQLRKNYNPLEIAEKVELK